MRTAASTTPRAAHTSRWKTCPAWFRKEFEFVVQDAKSKEDLTRAVLTQIIVEEEQKGQNLLPISFLRQLIGLYGDSMRWMVPQYLETMTAWFARNQEQMRKQFQSSLGVFPFNSIEDLSKQNMTMFEQAMRMFNPFAPRGLDGNGPDGPDPPEDTAQGPGAPPRAQATGGEALDEMRQQLAAMQRQLDALAQRKQG